MPDHFQGIIGIDSDTHQPTKYGRVGAHRCAPCPSNNGQWIFRPPRTLGSLIAQFKATTTRRINELRRMPGAEVWQRGYHDRIVRNEVELDKTRAYICNNPKNA